MSIHTYTINCVKKISKEMYDLQGVLIFMIRPFTKYGSESDQNARIRIRNPPKRRDRVVCSVMAGLPLFHVQEV